MRMKLILAGAVGLLLPLSAAMAETVDQLFVFGDSLSDAGNASIATLGAQPPSSSYYFRNVTGVPFPVGEFTNAPTSNGPTGVWVDQLAPKLGVSMAQPFLAGGTNYAVASGQTSGGTPGTSVSDQLGVFAATHPTGASGTGLYTFWAGANDIAAGANPITAADNIYQDILSLAGAGAKTFLWMNLPDLGKIPDGIATGPAGSALATQASLAFDAEWATDLAKLQGQGLFVVGIDVDGLFNQILANPTSYGFTDVTDPAITTPGANPDQFLFWDGEHPTAAADSLVASVAFNDLSAAEAVPEPATLGFAMIGFSAVCFFVRRKKR
jgi:thermolabile hemolysin